MVSREYFQQTKPNLKSYLLNAGYASDEDDAFDVAMRGVRSDWASLLQRRSADLSDED